jgi:hypothetical protein
MPKRGVTPAKTRKILLGFPGVDEGSSYGTAGFRVRKKFLARFRDDDTVLVIKCGDVERDLRLQADPKAFFILEHYRGYPTVLVRLAEVTADTLRDVIEVGWERLASKRMRDDFHRTNEE